MTFVTIPPANHLLSCSVAIGLGCYSVIQIDFQGECHGQESLGIVASIGMALLMLQIILLTANFAGVEAYPAPPAPATPAGYPAQNQSEWGSPTTQPPQPTQTPPNLPYKLYLPVVSQPCPFRFGIGSATQAQTEQVIPNCSIPPYRWDLAPDPDSSIQMIRRCHSHRGVSQQYICWIVNHPTYDSGTDAE